MVLTASVGWCAEQNLVQIKVRNQEDQGLDVCMFHGIVTVSKEMYTTYRRRSVSETKTQCKDERQMPKYRRG